MSLPPFQTGFAPEPDGGRKPFVTLGSGPLSMVVVPGAADGLRTCVEVALYLAWFYRERASRCRIVILSRREPLPVGFGIERHADDMIRTVEQLGCGPSIWECLSAAGPIGQWIAVKRPDLVRGLVLSSSYDVVVPRTRKVLMQWRSIAAHQAGIEAFTETLEQKYRPPPDVLSQLDQDLLSQKPEPRGPERMLRLLDELVELDQRHVTPRIACPTLVIGGANDRVVPAEVQREMSERIASSSLELCAGFGHFTDMENPAYEQRICHFVAGVTAQ